MTLRPSALAVLALLALPACRPDRGAGAPAVGAAADTTLGAPEGLLRGTVILAADGSVFRPCEGGPDLWLVDQTGGVLTRVHDELEAGGTGIYTEVLARPIGVPAIPEAAAFTDAVAVTEVRRAAREGGACEEALDFVVRARGSEPAWSVTVRVDAVVFEQPAEPARLEFPAPVPSAADGRRTWSAAAGGHRVELTVEEAPCTDPMSGEYSALSARATVDGRDLRGCAVDGQ